MAAETPLVADEIDTRSFFDVHKNCVDVKNNGRHTKRSIGL